MSYSLIWRVIPFSIRSFSKKQLSRSKIIIRKIKMPAENIAEVSCYTNDESLSNKRQRCECVANKHDNDAVPVIMEFAKLSDNATAPTRGSPLAAGFDLYSAYDYIVPAKGKEIVKTDIQIAVPDGCYGRVAPRSGLAAKNFIDVGAGVIDQDYRGNVGVVLFNFSETDFKVNKGDRIAQLICERIYIPQLCEKPSLDNTERGTGGFGSTGTN